MSTVNPFYRFEDAPEVASMAQGAKRISYATNELFAAINNFYTGQSLTDVVASVQTQVDLFNLDYNANFVVERINFPQSLSSPYTAQIYVYDTNIVLQYPLMKISMVFELSVGTIVNNASYFIGFVNEYYSYDAPLLETEKRAYEALVNNYQSGSVIFPNGYVFNKTTGIAKSYLARCNDCKFDSTLGYPVRVPADTLPRGSSPRIVLEPFDGNGRYFISLFDRLIVLAGFNSVVYADLFAEYQSWVLPQGFSTTYYEETLGGQRLQINIFEATGNSGYSLILREDNGFTFQRFYAPFYLETNFLSYYSGGLELPYEPTAFKVRYFSSFYDFDLCDFQECQFPKKEIYPMPIKSGDELRFNVIRPASNVLAEVLCDVGIFDSNGNLIQKVGEAESVGYECACTPCDLTITYSISALTEPVDEYLSQLNTYTFNEGQYQFQIWFYVIDDTDTVLTSGSYTSSWDEPVGFGETLDAATAAGVTQTQEIGPPPLWVWEYVYQNAPCDRSYRIVNTVKLLSDPPIETTIWSSENESCQLPPLEIASQRQAISVIPNLANGCYRLGLFRKESALEGLESIFEQQALPIGTLYLTLVTPLGTSGYSIAIPTSLINWNDVIEWIKYNVGFLSSTVDQLSNQLTLSFYPYVPLSGWSIQIGNLDYTTGQVTGISFTPNTLQPTGNTNINELYSLSNLLELDNSDCFSTIVQYYGEDGSVAEGYEYYNNWYQQVRLGVNGGGQKPVITESLYRQSNGIHKRPQSKQDLSIDLHTDFLDFETQCALVDATRHPYFVVDGRNLFVNGDIEVATVQDFTTQSSFEDLAQVKFSALVQGYQPKNSTCINC